MSKFCRSSFAVISVIRLALWNCSGGIEKKLLHDDYMGGYSKSCCRNLTWDNRSAVKKTVGARTPPCGKLAGTLCSLVCAMRNLTKKNFVKLSVIITKNEMEYFRIRRIVPQSEILSQVCFTFRKVTTCQYFFLRLH